MKKIILGLLLCLSITGCASEPELDGTVIHVPDVGVFELQHRLADSYLLHKLDTKRIQDTMNKIEEAKREAN